MADSTDTNQVRFYILGSIRIEVDGVDRPIVGRQQRHVLALLIVAAGRPISTDYLVDHLWPDEAPATARKTVQGFIHHLRSATGDLLKTEQGGYSLASGGAVDAVVFEEQVVAGRALDDPVAAVSRLRSALDMWRGDPFADLDDDLAFRAERARLEELHLSALEALYDARMRTGVTTELLPALEGSVAANPLRDRFRRQLMLALYRCGRQAEALRVFQDYRTELAELGLEPPEDTALIERQIAQRDPALDLEPADRRSLRGYEILDRLGEGAFSVVYRGRQPSVERDVAIKQIRAELANRPEFIRRFEAEAHMVARLEHPHIVPLIDYWREPGSAYLVMRLLRGGSLESSVLEGRWSLDRTVRMVDQIGAALAASHRADVVHRDVKSANILLDVEGNAYLSDFGIALEAAESANPAAALSAGSPAYASPEQLRREPVGAPADVHGLAIAVYEALTGRLPFPDEPSQAALLQRQLHDPIPLIRSSRSDIPPAIDDVLQRATAKLAADRYPTISEFIDALDAAAQPSVPATPNRSARTTIALEDRNPYKGLRAFDEADAGDFAGRARLVDKMAEVLDRERVVTVVGPSGSGKSSVVRAGLIPALRRGQLVGSDEWFVVTILPGARPFEELEAGLTRIASDQPIGLMGVLQDGERGIGRAIRNVLPDHGQLLLVIDQFEELFTLCPDEAKRRLFLDGITSALSQERSRLRVVLTLRADFYDRPLRYESIGRLVRDSTVPVLPLAADELEHAIVDPAAAVGAEFEPGLVSELVADVSDQPGALPMLQYALTELYERRISGLMTRDAYQKLGGVTGALSLRAEEIYSASNADEQSATRRLVGRLVNLGDGVEDTRRRALRSELAVSVAAKVVIERFGSARLLSFDTDPATREPTVEVAHEALIREWPRLGRWLEEDRDDLRVMRHLNSSAAEWDAAGRPDSELYRGGRLESAQDWAAEDPTEPAALESAFLAASSARRIAEVDAERRTSRRLKRLLVGVGVVAVIALVAGAVAVQQQQRAVDQAELASLNAANAVTEKVVAETATALALEQTNVAEESAALATTQTKLAEENAVLAEQRRLEAESALFDSTIRRMTSDSADLAESEPALSMLVAATAYQVDPSPETLGALQRTLARTDGLLGFLGPDTAYGSVGFATEQLLIGRSETGIDVWNVEERRIVRTIALDGGGKMKVLSAGYVVATSSDGGLHSFDLETGEIVASASPEPTGIRDISVDQESGRIAVLTERDHVVVLDFDLNEISRQLPDFSPFNVAMVGESVVVSARAQLIMLDGFGLPVWTSDLAEAAARIGGLPDGFAGSFEYDSIAFGQAEAVIYALKVPSGVTSYDATDGSVVGFSPTRSQVTSLGAVERTLLAGVTAIDVETGQATRTIPPTEGADISAISPGGGLAVLAGTKGIMLWSLDGSQLLASAAPANNATIASVDRRGERLGWVSWPNGVSGLWDLTESRPIISEQLADTWMLTWLPSGSLMTFEFSAETLILGADNFAPRGVGVPPQSWSSFNSSPDDRVAVVGGQPPEEAGQIKIYDVDSGVLTNTILDFVSDGQTPGDTLRWSEFSPDGTLLAATINDGRAALIDTKKWLITTRISLPDGEPINQVVFSNDGLTLGLRGAGGTIYFQDLETSQISTGPTAGEPSNRGLMTDFAFGPRDETVVVGTKEGIQVWDRDTNRAIGGLFPNESLFYGIPTYDGRQAVTGFEGNLLVWNLDSDEWPEIACAAAGRNMTNDEWEQFGPIGSPYRVTCPQWPAPGL